jgi:RimJ/RimL family protein N-acetyltransferase
LKPFRTLAITLEPIEGDARRAVAALLEDRPLRAALYGGRGNVAEADAISAWCGARVRGTLRLAAHCPELDEVVGAVGLVGDELSYFVARAHWRSGYGSAMLGALLRPCGESSGTRRLFARVARDNVASRRLLEAAGFAERGLEVRPGGLSPEIRYERIAPQPPFNT